LLTKERRSTESDLIQRKKADGFDKMVFFIPGVLSKLARGYLSSVQKTRHSAFGGRKESEMVMMYRKKLRGILQL
jgi:hypothetical protein